MSEICFSLIPSSWWAPCRIWRRARGFIRRLLPNTPTQSSGGAGWRSLPPGSLLWCLTLSFNSFSPNSGTKFRCPKVHKTSECRNSWAGPWGYLFFRGSPWPSNCRYPYWCYQRGRGCSARNAFWQAYKNSWTASEDPRCRHKSQSNY